MSDSSSDALDGAVKLYQFAFSHFNEKARWVLDWKGVRAEQISLLPGFHVRTAKKLTGATQTPFLTIGEERVAGSAAILERIEELRPTPALFPESAAERAEVEKWVTWLDEEVGPDVRLGLFDELLSDPSYAAQIFAAGHPGWKGRGYALIFPRLIPMLRGKMSVNAEAAANANERIEAALDRVAEAVKETGYLVGKDFGAADLTAAALLFPLCFPAGLPFRLPAEESAAMTRWRARWEGHPAVAWVEEIFRRHRRGPML